MLEKIYDFLGWTNGQRNTFERLRKLVRNPFPGGFSTKRVFIVLLAVVELFLSAAFKTGVHPYGQELDLSDYKLVFCDDFEDGALNTDVWRVRPNEAKRTGRNSASQISFRDGNLVITGEYCQTGEYGEGWYGSAIALKQLYTRGYFEIRCICNDKDDFWSAFWLQSGHSYDEQSNGGIGGAEIDIFETPLVKSTLMPWERNVFSHTVWCNGVDDSLDTLDKCSFDGLGKNVCKEFNTIGLEWTEDEYIFYVNGRETGRTSFGKGTSTAPEELIVSLEIPSYEITLDKSEKTEFIVDYVKVWQK